MFKYSATIHQMKHYIFRGRAGPGLSWLGVEFVGSRDVPESL